MACNFAINICFNKNAINFFIAPIRVISFTCGGGFQYYVPSGMQLANGTFPTGLEPSAWASKGKGATVRPPSTPEWTIVYVQLETVPEKPDRLLSVQVHAFRRSHWASWMFDVESVAADKILFGKGGYQGCRGGPGEPLMPAEL